MVLNGFVESESIFRCAFSGQLAVLWESAVWGNVAGFAAGGSQRYESDSPH